LTGYFDYSLKSNGLGEVDAETGRAGGELDEGSRIGGGCGGAGSVLGWRIKM